MRVHLEISELTRLMKAHCRNIKTVHNTELTYGFEPVGEPDGAKIHSQDARLMCSGH